MSFFAGFFVALWAGAKQIFKRRYTLRYPEQRLDILMVDNQKSGGYEFDPKKQVATAGFKGRHILYMDKCTGCSLCAIACENIASCIDMVKVDKSFVQNKKSIFPQIDYGRCVFCGFCVDACPFDCLFMTPFYELATTDKRLLVYTPEMLNQYPQLKGEYMKFIPDEKSGAHHG